MASKCLLRDVAGIHRVWEPSRGGAFTCWNPPVESSDETSLGIRFGEIIKRSLRG